VRVTMRRPRLPQACAIGFLCGWGAAATHADPPPSPDTNKGGFMSSLKQAFRQDIEHEEVRGHFDVGSPPDARRYYCLVDPKSGRNEPNGVSGEPVHRKDGTTRIKGGAVSPLSCDDAEQKRLLVTEGYTVTGAEKRARNAASAAAPAATIPQPAAPAAAARVAAAPVAATPVASAAAVPAPLPATAAAAAAHAAGESSPETEVTALFARFIAAQNAHDRAVVSEIVLDSKDFVWGQSGGGSLWGHDQAMQAFEHAWKGSWKLEPQLEELRAASIAPDAAVLVTPLLFTSGNPGEEPATVPLRWSAVFVKTRSGWRIASIFTTPFKAWRAGR
jgi:Domain of unknown function (DUF4440)